MKRLNVWWESCNNGQKAVTLMIVWFIGLNVALGLYHMVMGIGMMDLYGQEVSYSYILHNMLIAVAFLPMLFRAKAYAENSGTGFVWNLLRRLTVFALKANVMYVAFALIFVLLLMAQNFNFI